MAGCCSFPTPQDLPHRLLKADALKKINYIYSDTFFEFPEYFKVGAASSYQIESLDGKSPSSVDFYHLYKEDVNALKNTGEKN